MSLTLAQARTELQVRGLDFLSNTRANAFLNDAMHEFHDYANWYWLETTTTGAAPLTIADLRDVLYVVDATNQNELANQDIRDLIDVDAAQVSTGTPVSYWIDNTTIKVWPTATVNLSVRYVKVPTDLSADSDVPTFPSKYHSLWVTLAQARVYAQDENFSAQAEPLKQSAYQDLQNAAQLLMGRMLDAPATQNLTSDPDSSLWRGGW